MKRAENSKERMANTRNKAVKRYADLLKKEMLEDWEKFSNVDEGWRIGYMDGYTNCCSRIPSYATEQFKRGYASGAYVGREDFLRAAD